MTASRLSLWSAFGGFLALAAFWITFVFFHASQPSGNIGSGLYPSFDALMRYAALVVLFGLTAFAAGCASFRTRVGRWGLALSALLFFLAALPYFLFLALEALGVLK